MFLVLLLKIASIFSFQRALDELLKRKTCKVIPVSVWYKSYKILRFPEPVTYSVLDGVIHLEHPAKIYQFCWPPVPIKFWSIAKTSELSMILGTSLSNHSIGFGRLLNLVIFCRTSQVNNPIQYWWCHRFWKT